MSKHTKNYSPKPKKLDINCYSSQKYFLNGLRVQILGGPCGLNKKIKFSENILRNPSTWGRRPTPRERKVLPTSQCETRKPCPPRASNTHSPTFRKKFVLLIFPDEGHFYRNLKTTVNKCQSLYSTTDNSP